MRRWEAPAYRPFARVVLVTDEDAREVARLDPSLHVVTIPNGVDAAHFAPPTRRDADGILFTGALDAPANEQAALRLAERIMPLVRRADPGRRAAARRPQPRARRVRALERAIADVARPAAVPVERRRLRLPDGERHGDQEQAAGGDGRGRAGGRDAARHARASTRAVSGRRRPTRRSPRRSSRRSATRRAPPGRPTPRARTSARTTTGTPWPGPIAPFIGHREDRSRLSRDVSAEMATQLRSARGPRVGDTSAPSVVSGGLWTLLNRLLPQAQLLALSIIAARFLGPTDMGRQSYIAFVALALVQAATAGFPVALTRYIGELLGARRGDHAMALYRFTRRVELVAAALVLAVLLVVAALGSEPRAAWALAGLSGALAVLQAVPMSLLAGAQRWRQGRCPGSSPASPPCRRRSIVLEAGGGITGLFAVEAAAVFGQPAVDLRAGAAARRPAARAVAGAAPNCADASCRSRARRRSSS